MPNHDGSGCRQRESGTGVREIPCDERKFLVEMVQRAGSAENGTIGPMGAIKEEKYSR